MIKKCTNDIDFSLIKTSYNYYYQPEYDKGNLDILSLVEDKLENFTPITQESDIAALYKNLQLVYEGKKLLFQHGDCAELFSEMTTQKADAFYKMSMDINQFMEMDLLILGRIAGQTCKPRSSTHEIINNQEIATYSGDMINNLNPDTNLRKADPLKLLQNYNLSKYMFDYIIKNYPDIYPSHEALHMIYENALIRNSKIIGDYASSAPFLWIGDATRDLASPQINFAKRIANPIGVKISSKITVDEFINLIHTLNPNNKIGRLTVICRFGYNKINMILPQLIEASQNLNAKIIWVCDPMHGNTIKASNNKKIRILEHIKLELEHFFAIHKKYNSKALGIHLESSVDNDIQECIYEKDFNKTKNMIYKSACDPRVTLEQIKFIVTNIKKGNDNGS